MGNTIDNNNNNNNNNVDRRQFLRGSGIMGVITAVPLIFPFFNNNNVANGNNNVANAAEITEISSFSSHTPDKILGMDPLTSSKYQYWHKPDLFDGAAIFERLSHFKDYGIPGTVGDPFNQAMIADGTCRVLGYLHSGYCFLKNSKRTSRVLQALANLPDTSRPSYFVSEAQKQLIDACAVPKDMEYLPQKDVQTFDFKVVKESMENWHRALCAPEGNAAWNGVYDPANQVQQMALTSGFMCIVACDLHHDFFESKNIFALSEFPQESVDEICANIPFGSIDFSSSYDWEDLDKKSNQLIGSPCKCSNGRARSTYF